jgi:hypothetical protein
LDAVRRRMPVLAETRLRAVTGIAFANALAESLRQDVERIKAGEQLQLDEQDG